ncbi:YicC family protein [Hydrogenovibrio sp. 3SP14C1]|uniref:YicC/YloC family endoribonuclease n=1 Tax=Hydrogenovibrio sp. 3SP14C1 TaxID=3038774 RepID=UPI002416111A|nr:YicC/YloC family endoribonuclease [Hydrogenovibrio sp. 3SP14C1]MDG4811488.1 YicC family protein [Hydrogenovibrio sp. 3SP14C1]
MKSMTAFALSKHSFDWGSLTWELRAVNQRYLEIHLRIPDSIKPLEMAIREHLKKQISRGKVEATLRLSITQSDAEFCLNEALLKDLTQAIQTVQMALPEATQVNPVDLLKWPGLLQNQNTETNETLNSDIINSLQTGLNEFNQTRSREGASLQRIIIEKSQAMRALVTQAQTLLPEIQAHFAEQLKHRIIDLTDSLDEVRYHQEIAIQAQKMDVAEELDRLNTHLDEVERLVQTTGVVGRRLDFLMQELNREANTLGSKSIDSRTAQISVELKVLIEQIREQIQNIE